MAMVFIEFVSLTNVNNDESYFRFVEYGDSHYSSQWRYRVGRNLELSGDHDELEEKYFETLENLGLAPFFNH